MYYFYLYLAVINLIAIIVTCCDKRRAIKNKWRIKEATLFTISILGGSFAMYITMRLIRHKTKHKRFMFGIPFILLLQAVIWIVVTYYVS